MYAGTFSKTLFPALRMAYLVVPADLTEAFTQQPATWLRLSAAAAGRRGGFYPARTFLPPPETHAAAVPPAARWLTQALERQLGTWLTAVPQQGGIQLLARLRDGVADTPLAAQAWQQGLAAQALSDWRIDHPAGQGLLLGFANFTRQEETGRRCRGWRSCSNV